MGNLVFVGKTQKSNKSNKKKGQKNENSKRFPTKN